MYKSPWISKYCSKPKTPLLRGENADTRGDFQLDGFDNWTSSISDFVTKFCPIRFADANGEWKGEWRDSFTSYYDRNIVCGCYYKKYGFTIKNQSNYDFDIELRFKTQTNNDPYWYDENVKIRVKRNETKSLLNDKNFQDERGGKKYLQLNSVSMTNLPFDADKFKRRFVYDNLNISTLKSSVLTITGSLRSVPYFKIRTITYRDNPNDSDNGHTEVYDLNPTRQDVLDGRR